MQIWDKVLEDTHGKKDSDEQWSPRKLPNLLQKCCADDIYNTDETGLFNHSMLDSSLSYKYAILSGAKEAVVRVNVLCC
jgi:hypothetical protein